MESVKFRHAIACVASAGFLSACAGIHPRPMEFNRIVTLYEAGVEKTVSVGGTMLTKMDIANGCYHYVCLMDYEPPDPVQMGVKFKRGDVFTSCLEDTVHTNYVYLVGAHPNGNLVLSIQKDGYVGRYGGWWELVFGRHVGGPAWTDKQLFTREADIYPGGGSTREEFVYLGRSGQAVHIGYRLASLKQGIQPVSQDLTYDLTESDVVTYRNYSFKIIKAENREITFYVLNDNLPVE